jgi:acyl-CoA hydrolase
VAAVRQDRMNFLQPAFVGETITAQALVTKTWNTSMEVQVEVTAHNPQSGQTRLIGNSYLVYVALSPDGIPAQAPPWLPVTALQIERAKAADFRRAIRKEEAAQISEHLIP